MLALHICEVYIVVNLERSQGMIERLSLRILGSTVFRFLRELELFQSGHLMVERRKYVRH